MTASLPFIEFTVQGKTLDEVKAQAAEIAIGFFGPDWAPITYEWEAGHAEIVQAVSLAGDLVSTMVGPFEFTVTAS